MEDTAPMAVGSLSPSRAADFRQCALAFRFRTVDRLPEEPSSAAVRGTVVHRVLERLFDLPAAARTPAAAVSMLEDAWGEVVDAEPAVTSMFGTDHPWDAWLASCEEVLLRWFGLEDPTRLEPALREEHVEALLDSGLLLRGVVDRIDESDDGALTVVDYKTGKAPPPGREAGAMFQMRFYALVVWLTRGAVPAELRLVYLGSGEILGYRPDVADLEATRRLLERVWEAVRLARETGDFAPNPGWQCGYCDYRALCPAFGGTPPPYPRRGSDPERGHLGQAESDQGVTEDPPVAG